MAAQDGKIWFGTARNARWVKAPLADMSASANGYVEEQQFNNGGQFVKASFGSARSFDMSWVGDRSDLQVIKDYKDGIYGGGLLYWCDPFAYNVLPPHWAAPMLTVRDWPSLISSGNKPEPVTHSTTPNNYPYQSALYQVTNNEETSRSLTILIPEDHCIYIGFAYSATGTAAVRAVKVLEDGSDGDAVVLSPLSVTDTTLTTNVFSNSLALGEKVVALRIYISRTDNSTSTITMRGGFAKILPNEKMLPSFAVEEQWVSGEGFSGCVMASAPQMTYKGMVDGRRLVTMSTTLKEIGAWL